jgi:hypothetical protein
MTPIEPGISCNGVLRPSARPERSGNPLRVVFSPDALGGASFHPAAAPVRDAWREGRLQPVVCRALILRYLRLLHRLGLPERTVRWWGWWLGSPDKTLLLPDPSGVSAVEVLCEALAGAAGSGCVPVYWRLGPGETGRTDSPWITLDDLALRCAAHDAASTSCDAHPSSS